MTLLANSRSIMKSEDDNANLDLITKRFCIFRTTGDIVAAESVGEMIPQSEGQHKCDYLIYCAKRLQTCYIELKGKNISLKKEYNPYDQI